MELFKYLSDNGKYSDSFKGELENLFTLREFSKGDHLFKEGEVCRYLYLYKKGACQGLLQFEPRKGNYVMVFI
jgi:CRP-like cAMP-binding protein